MNTASEISKKLKVIRAERKMTQSDVAEIAGLNTNYYAKVERGEAAATVEALQKIAKALDVKSSDILPF